MLIQFDTAKDAANQAKHGVSLAFGARVFDGADMILLASSRPIDGEDRFKAVGLVDGRLWTAVHVYRGRFVRMISVRRSNGGAQGNYDRHTGRSG